MTTNCRLIVKFIGCFLNSAKSAPDIETVSGLKKVVIKTRVELSLCRVQCISSLCPLGQWQ